MYEINSYLGKMSSGLLSNDRLYGARYGKPKKKKQNRIKQVSPHANFRSINFTITEDDLP